MKVWIDKDEWYPVYSIELDAGDSWSQNEYEVDEALIKRYQAAKTEFDLVQHLLGDILTSKETATA